MDVGAQTSLFPDVERITVYEQPLNERIRSCLRLEHLFSAVEDGIGGESEWHTRAAIVAMLEISDLLSRTDIKGELIKELERHAGKITAFRDKPGVDPSAVDRTMSSLTPLIAELKSGSCHPGASIRHDELINQVKQRISIPGGTCNFDIPAFHHWLSKPCEYRSNQLQHWVKDLAVVQNAVTQVLTMLRDSSRSKRVFIDEGMYQQQLDPALQCQLIRLSIDGELDVFPEISGGKHRFVVRFFRQPQTNGRPAQVLERLSFELQCCSI